MKASECSRGVNINVECDSSCAVGWGGKRSSNCGEKVLTPQVERDIQEII